MKHFKILQTHFNHTFGHRLVLSCIVRSLFVHVQFKSYYFPPQSPYFWVVFFFFYLSTSGMCLHYSSRLLPCPSSRSPGDRNPPLDELITYKHTLHISTLLWASSISSLHESALAVIAWLFVAVRIALVACRYLDQTEYKHVKWVNTIYVTQCI